MASGERSKVVRQKARRDFRRLTRGIIEYSCTVTKHKVKLEGKVHLDRGLLRTQSGGFHTGPIGRPSPTGTERNGTERNGTERNGC